MPEPSILSQNGVAVTTENNVEEESDHDSAGFALSVDLSACAGAGARCRVWARRRGRRVRWLAARVRRAARLRGAFLMLAGADLLPPDEPLRLLKTTDTLRVERVEKEWQRPFCFNDDSENPEDLPPVKLTADTRKRRAEPQLSPAHKSPLIPSPAEDTSPLVSTPADDAMQVNWRTFGTPVATPDQLSSITDEALKRVKQRALALLQQVATEEQGEDDVDAPKKRRRRVRRRRRPASFTAPEPMSGSAPTESLAASSPPLPAVSLPETSSISPQTSAMILNPLASDLARPFQPDTSPVLPVSVTRSVCPSSDPLVSPVPSFSQTRPVATLPVSPSTPTSPGSQSSRAVPALPSSPWAPAVLGVCTAPAPVLRNQAATRAPRVVRALSAGPSTPVTTNTLSSSSEAIQPRVALSLVQ